MLLRVGSMTASDIGYSSVGAADESVMGLERRNSEGSMVRASGVVVANRASFLTWRPRFKPLTQILRSLWPEVQVRSFRIFRNKVRVYISAFECPVMSHLKTLVPGDSGWYSH